MYDVGGWRNGEVSGWFSPIGVCTNFSTLKLYVKLVKSHTHTTILQLSGLWRGQRGWAGTRRYSRHTNNPDGLPPQPDYLVPLSLPFPPFYTRCPSWRNPPNLSWLGTGTKYAGLYTGLVSKVKWSKWSTAVHKHASLLQELTCHMDHTVLPATRERWHFHLYPQPIKAGTRFSDPRGMEG